MKSEVRSVKSGAGLLDDRRENGNQFVRFVRQRGKPVGRDKFGRCEKSEPVVGLASFLACDRILADKVGFALARLSFLDVRADGSTGTQ